MATDENHGVIVIGAGIVGVSIALHLLRRGVRATLVDRGDPGSGASFGNAGVLASGSVVPVTTPGLLKSIPAMLLTPGSPLFVRWLYLPRAAPWLVRYLGQCRPRRTAHTARHMRTLVEDSLDEHRMLARGTAAAKWIRPSRYAFAYRDRAAFDRDGFGWGLRRDNGIAFRVVEGAAVRELEPALSPDYQCLVLFEEQHGIIAKPSAYVQDLAEAVTSDGGSFERAEVTGFEVHDGRVDAVRTAAGRLRADTFVIAAGAWSARLTRKLGLRIPLESERGYHVEFKGPSLMPNSALMFADAKVVATPMDEGLRVAGLVEFGGLDAGENKNAVASLVRHASRAFPGLAYESHTQWLGHRPAPTDSLPVIGRAGRFSNLFLAFGHHHVGLTSGPRTGRVVADLITRQRTNWDLSPFRVERFGGSMSA